MLDLVYRHAVRPEDRFVMRPGYEGFQRIRRGEVLADDAQGEVRAPSDGRVLMPLYQPQGSDGFFVVRAVGRLPLKLSAAARRVGLRRLPFRFRRPPVVPHHGAPISDGAPAPTAAHAPQSPEKTR